MDQSGNSLRGGPDAVLRRVSLFYDDQIGSYNYGEDHEMKPLRIEMTQSLVVEYGLHRRMEVVRPPRASFEQLTQYHSPEYVAFLRSVRPSESNDRNLKKFNMDVDGDCPVFEGLYPFCQTSAGGSIAGAAKLNSGDADIVINWAGGLHHAQKSQASGFCYINDIVLAILELLNNFQRVLYVDIDVHHGDGVENAFYTIDRVMTVSFHQFEDEFFPLSGAKTDTGSGKGKHHCLNVPLKRGMNDESYHYLFKPIISKVMRVFQPHAVVLQCGADSLYGDALGGFNLSVRGHAECVKFLRSFNVPLMLLGGGGYTRKNVARCWCFETGVAVDPEFGDNMKSSRREPRSTLEIQTGRIDNSNTKAELDKILELVLKNLSKVHHAPSVQFSERRPETSLHGRQTRRQSEEGDSDPAEEEDSDVIVVDDSPDRDYPEEEDLDVIVIEDSPDRD